ncbi:MAG: tetratricopeptide repeat protein, partial [Bacteroidia bacterium]|nr:tetratricopeptide repeat protein [Bacteroidia bacterium]
NLADSAVTYYDKKEFGSAIRCYEKILSGDKDSWLLHYNLANAYYKNNQLGKAIQNYEIAKKLNPSDPDVQNNLLIADSKLQDKMDVKANFLEKKIREGVLFFFTTSGWAWLSIFSFAAGFALVFLFIISEKTWKRRLFFWLGIVGFIIFFLAMVFGFAALKEKNAKGTGVITSNSAVDIFKEAGTVKEPYQLHEGTRIKVLNTENDWAFIKLKNGNEGWIKKSQFELY